LAALIGKKPGLSARGQPLQIAPTHSLPPHALHAQQVSNPQFATQPKPTQNGTKPKNDRRKTSKL